MKNLKIVKVQRVEFADQVSVFDLDAFARLLDLADKGAQVLETDSAFFLLKEQVAFRVLKPNAKPQILRCKDFQASPDSFSAKAELDYDDLVSFALKNGIVLFENQSEILAPSELFMFAKKPKEKEIQHE